MKVILDGADENSLLNLTTQQRMILCSLVDFGNDYNQTLRPAQRYKLQEYSLSLTSSSIRVLGFLGDEVSKLALQHRMQSTQSPYIYDLIAATLKRPVIQDGSNQNDHNLNDEDMQREQFSRPSIEKATRSDVKEPHMLWTVSASLLFMCGFIIEILILLMSFPLYLSLFCYMIQLFIIMIFIETAEVKRRVGIEIARSDSPYAIGHLLASESHSRVFLSRPANSLLIGELSNDLTIENPPILNQNQLTSLHLLLLTHNKMDVIDLDPSISEYTTRRTNFTRHFLHMPLLWIRGFQKQVDGNQMPNVTPSTSILRAIGILGNAGSVRFLERYIANTTDPTLVASAQDSLAALKQRLAVTPQELLRASAVTGDGLLQPASNTTEDVLLRPVSTRSDVAVEESAVRQRLGG